ncbi:MAG: protein kinase [Planctomyces sp.]|nr:protein kinase [Planctomyces sp.]
MNSEQEQNPGDSLDQQVNAAIAAYYAETERLGTEPDRAEFLARYPHVAGELAEFFENLELIGELRDRQRCSNELNSTNLTDNSAEESSSLVNRRSYESCQDEEQLWSGGVRYFGEYEILEVLGRGGMGVVYKARETRLGRIVALKMIRSGNMATPNDVRRFKKETRSASRLVHPGIVSVHQVGVYRGQHYYTMDYVEAGSLSELCRSGPTPPSQAAEYVLQIALAMEYAHRENVVHRDLKPANILLTANGRVRITDFGLARQLGAHDESGHQTLTETGQILGTAGYMSPEQASGRNRHVGALSDIYSMGAILYALLTGRAPFVGESAAHTILQVLRDDPVSPRVFNSRIPRDLETICLKCLQREPRRRYGTAEQLACDLQRFIEGKPIQGRKSGRIERTYRWCMRNRALSGLLALGILVLLLMPLVYWFQVSTAVTAIQNARGTALPALISETRQRYPDSLLRWMLLSHFHGEPDHDERLVLAMALSHLSEPQTQYLIEQLMTVSAGDFENYVEALETDRERAVKVISSRIDECRALSEWEKLASFAVLALRLGDESLSAEIVRCGMSQDPTPRTAWIHAIGRWEGETTALLECIRRTSNEEIRSAVFQGMSTLPEDQVRSQEKAEWLDLARSAITDPNALVASSARVLISKWNVALPEQAVLPAEPKGNWYRNVRGQTFCLAPAGQLHRKPAAAASEVPGGSSRDVIQISIPFWICDSEVSVGLFREFVEDPQYPSTEKPPHQVHHSVQHSPTDLHPVQYVTWYDAILFCNWLSIKDGFTPAYHRTGAVEVLANQEIDVWQRDESASGYRLPTISEWEYACLAGAESTYCHGENEELLSGFAVIHSDQSEPCGSRLPNHWGIFDMHGNVFEWCDDQFQFRTVRGGAFSTGPKYCIATSGPNYSALARMPNIGFRVVRPATVTGRQVPSQSPGVINLGVIKLTGRRLFESTSGLTCLQYSEDSTKLVFGGFDREAVLLDLQTLQVVRSFRGHEGTIWTLSLAPDGRTFVTGSEDKTIRLWDTTTGDELDKFTGGGIFSNVHYTPDGSHVYATCWDGKLRIWNLLGKKLTDLREYDLGEAALDATFLPDGRRYYVGTIHGNVFEFSDSSEKQMHKFRTHSGWIHSLVSLGAGGRIVSASHDHTLRLRNYLTGRLERTYRGHSGVVNEVRMVPGGAAFVSCSRDRTIRQWDTSSGNELARGVSTGELRAISMRPDGKACVTAGFDGAIREWELIVTTDEDNDTTAVGSDTHGDLGESGLWMDRDEFQDEFDRQAKEGMVPDEVDIDVSQDGSRVVYSATWKPRGSVEFATRHGISDEQLHDEEIRLSAMGFQRQRIKTTRWQGANLHIVVWAK